ncbi:hypothetical protein [Streptomyces sp. SID1121]|uniref:hypothetical protein n=1 Tax=Streptomyces sp. SID1121 TaxID=3425888 RepID=UPI0040562F0A
MTVHPTQAGDAEARCDLCGSVVAVCTLRRRHFLKRGQTRWFVQLVCTGEEACYVRRRDLSHWHRVGAAVPASPPPEDAFLVTCGLCDIAAALADLEIEVGTDRFGPFIDGFCSDTEACSQRRVSRRLPLCADDESTH